jgi:plasmid replication initiation protein
LATRFSIEFKSRKTSRNLGSFCFQIHRSLEGPKQTGKITQAKAKARKMHTEGTGTREEQNIKKIKNTNPGKREVVCSE